MLRSMLRQRRSCQVRRHTPHDKPFLAHPKAAGHRLTREENCLQGSPSSTSVCTVLVRGAGLQYAQQLTVHVHTAIGMFMFDMLKTHTCRPLERLRSHLEHQHQEHGRAPPCQPAGTR